MALVVTLLLPAIPARSLIPDSSPIPVDVAPAVHEAQGQTRRLFLPLVLRRAGHNPDARFGLQMYFSTETQVAEAAAAGAGQVRIPLAWAMVEPTNTSPSEFRWSATYEEGLARIAANEMGMILTIEGNPSWAATNPGGPIDKVPISEFVDFVVAAVQRYSVPPYNVKLWEFYNEPDNGDELWAIAAGLGYWGNEPEAYADLLAAVYQPIKEADPEAQVLLGGIAHDWYDWWEEDEELYDGPFVRDFLDRVLSRVQENGGGSFDVLNFHYYPTAFAGNWAAWGPGLVGKSTYLRQKLSSYGLDKPVVCTEAGVDGVDAITYEVQSSYVPILYAQAMASELQSLSWFMLVDQDPGYWKTGLLRADLSRKPAFYAYQTAAARLGHSSYLGALSLEEKGTAAMEAYHFLAGDGWKRFIVAWTNDGLSYPLALPAGRVLVADKYGSQSWKYDEMDGHADGVTTVNVGSSPVYLYPES
jgi:hypothetical protein